MAAVAYWLLQHLIINSEGADSIVKRAVGRVAPRALLAAPVLVPGDADLSPPADPSPLLCCTQSEGNERHH
jgi:hypothetical protein